MSVVMAYYNAAAFVGEAVESVLGQTIEDLELLLVDDASTDDGLAELRALDDPRLRIIRLERNQGPSVARNVALEQAQAPLVAICDADDVCERTRLELQIDYLAHHLDVDVLGSQISVINEDGHRIGQRCYPLSSEEIVRAMPAWCPIAHSTVMYRKDVIDGGGVYEASRRLAEDYELWSRLAVSGKRFANLPKQLVRYRVHVQAAKLRSARPLILATLDVKWRYWRSRPRLEHLVRAAGELVLLVLPQRLVWQLFVALEYGRTRGPADAA